MSGQNAALDSKQEDDAMAREIVNNKDVYMPHNINLSHAVKSNGFIFVMGCGARDLDGRIVGSEIRTQTRKALENANAILMAANATLEDAVRVTCYLIRTEDVEGFNEVYNSVFSKEPPARSLFLIQGFRDPRMLVEVEITARDPAFGR